MSVSGLFVRRANALIEAKVRAIDKAKRFILLHLTATFVMVRLTLCDRHAFVQMQFARAAIIKQAVSDVGVLLDFNQRQTRPNGVHGVGGQIEEIARFCRMPFEQVFD